MVLMSFVPAPSNSCQTSNRRGQAIIRNCATYFQVVWLEYLYLSVVAAFTLALYCTPMYYKEYRVVLMLPSITPSSTSELFRQYQLPMGISYPRVQEPIPTYGCAVVVVLVPSLVMSIFQIKHWSVWDFHAGVIGVLRAVVSTYVTTLLLHLTVDRLKLTKPDNGRSFFCTILKHFIGGFRPYYIEACKPDWDVIVGNLHQEVYRFNATSCLGDSRDVDRAYVLSFPLPMVSKTTFLHREQSPSFSEWPCFQFFRSCYFPCPLP